MPNKKKKAPHNDFYFFMQDQKNVLRQEGVEWANMQELATLCSPKWQAITDKDKAKYKEMAKQQKEKDRQNVAIKFVSQGRSVLSVQQEQVDAKQAVKSMLQNIDETISMGKDMGNLTRQKFYFVHVNILCQTAEKTYLPCEIALVEFSLGTGIAVTLQTFVRPPKSTIPVGYGYTISKHAKETHGLELDSEPMETELAKDYENMATQILSMLDPFKRGGELPPLYTMEEDVDRVTCILYDLFSWANVELQHDLKVFHIHHLFYRLANSQEATTGCVFRSELLAKDSLNSDEYMYTKDVACSFHDWHDKSQYCSLMHVKKWAFVMADYCCRDFGITLVAGIHRPVGDEETKVYPSKEIVLVPWQEDPNAVEPMLSAQHDTNMMGARVTRAAPAGVTVLAPETMDVFARKGVHQQEAMPVSSMSGFSPFDDWGAVGSTLPQEDDASRPENVNSGWQTMSEFPSLGSRPTRPSDNPDAFPSLTSPWGRGKRRGK